MTKRGGGERKRRRQSRSADAGQGTHLPSPCRTDSGVEAAEAGILANAIAEKAATPGSRLRLRTSLVVGLERQLALSSFRRKWNFSDLDHLQATFGELRDIFVIGVDRRRALDGRNRRDLVVEFGFRARARRSPVTGRNSLGLAS